MKRPNLIAAALAVCMLFGICAFPIKAEEQPVYILCGSDFQQGTHEGSAQNVRQICERVQEAGFVSPTGFFFAGDYDRNTIGEYIETQNGQKALDAVITQSFPDVRQKIYLQGNHDVKSYPGLASSGNNDAEGYGVYVINNDDYMWHNSDRRRIQQTSKELRDYLQQKVDEEYTKPVFVISHLPLHYSMRTRNDGDAQYANFLFDELNEAAALGLNVVFIYGHDHSNGWDNYLGASAVFLKPGDRIPVAQGSSEDFIYETLRFTYMNAGYTGYYASANGGDSTLTMTVIEISGDKMTFRRFDADGAHRLKSAGTFCATYDDRALLTSDKKVYESPQSLTVNKTVHTKGWFEDDAIGIAARTTGIGIDVTEQTDADANAFFGDPSSFSEYVSYTVSAVGTNIGKADLRVPIDGMTGHVRVYLKQGDGFILPEYIKDGGRACLSASLPATVVLAIASNPYASSAYAPLLWKVGKSEGAFTFLNLQKDLYLGCVHNLTLSEQPALLSVSPTAGGTKIALSESTGGKNAGDAIHFGTNNRCSFGECTPFTIYEYVDNDRFVEVTTPTPGSVVMMGVKKGKTAFLLNNTVIGERLGTDIKKVELVEGAQVPDKYKELYFTFERQGEKNSIKHNESGLYLTCKANATFGQIPAPFYLNDEEEGYSLALAEKTGDKARGSSLHLGSSNRVSFGEKTPLLLFRKAGARYYIETSPEDSGVYLIAFIKEDKYYALTGSATGGSSSERVETCEVNLPLLEQRQTDDLFALLSCLREGGNTASDRNGDMMITVIDLVWLLNSFK